MSESVASTSLDAAVQRGYALLRESCGLMTVADSVVMEMTGEDRKAWLQGQCTNDLRELGPGGSLQFCICSPTGQLLADCTAWSMPDRFLIACHKASGKAMLDRAESMIILEDVRLTDITDRFQWVSVQGPNASRTLAHLSDIPNLDAGQALFSGEETICLRNNRTGYGGWDLLLPKDSTAISLLRDNFEPVGPASVDICRLEAGIPTFGVDMGEKTLPPEMGPDFESKHVSYTKGCYTGQEVIMRIHSRGHTNKTWVTLVLEGSVDRKEIVTHGSNEDCGVVTSVVESPHFGFIAGAMVRNEAAFDGEQIVVRRAKGNVAGEVSLRPLLSAV